MSAPPITELTLRAREIFRLVVEGYLGSGQPVGSKALAGPGGVNLSSASIRSVLHELELLGLLGHPHTSAGRLPTDAGLRLFVDGIMQVAEPTAEERAAIERRLSEPGPIEAALEATSAPLSSLSAGAGVVMVPRREPRLAQLSSGAAVARPGSGGAGRRRRGGGEPGGRTAALALPPGALEEASNYITARLAGRTLAEAGKAMRSRDRLGPVGARCGHRAIWSSVVSRCGAKTTLRRPVLIVRGQANLLDEAALTDIERVRQLLDDLENKQSVAELLDLAREAEATRIFIGSENQLFALSGSSVIASPYRDRDGRVVGVVGVIGPTRLNYARVVPMVDFTARVWAN